MATSYERILADMPQAQRDEVYRRANELAAEEQAARDNFGVTVAHAMFRRAVSALEVFRDRLKAQPPGARKEALNQGLLSEVEDLLKDLEQ